MKYLLALAFFLFLISVVAVSADTTITDWRLTKAVAYEDQEVVLSVLVQSANSTTSVLAEIGKSGLTNITNQTFYNVSMSAIGSTTNGYWIYSFKEKQGIYEINRFIATDNASVVKAVNVHQISYFSLKIISNVTTTTSQTTQTTSTQTSSQTTSSQTTSQAAQTTSTTQQASPSMPLGNPFVWVLIILGIAIPFILVIVLLK